LIPKCNIISETNNNINDNNNSILQENKVEDNNLTPKNDITSKDNYISEKKLIYNNTNPNNNYSDNNIIQETKSLLENEITSNNNNLESEDNYIPDTEMANNNSLIKEIDTISRDSNVQNNNSFNNYNNVENKIINNMTESNTIVKNEKIIQNNEETSRIDKNINENLKIEQSKTYSSPKETLTNKEIEEIFKEGERQLQKLRYTQDPPQVKNQNIIYQTKINPESNNKYQNIVDNQVLQKSAEISNSINKSVTKITGPETATVQSIIYQEEPKEIIIKNNLKNEPINNKEDNLNLILSKKEYKVTLTPDRKKNVNKLNYELNNITVNKIITDNISNLANDYINNNMGYINKDLKKNPNIEIIDNTRNNDNNNSNNYINNININNNKIINKFSSVKTSKNKKTQKNEPIIQYTTTTIVEHPPILYSPQKEYNNISSQQYIEYDSQKRINDPNIYYNAPIITSKNKEVQIGTPIINSQNINYYSSMGETNHIIESAPTTINEPIIQYQTVEKTLPLTCSPTKYLSSIITYDESSPSNNVKHYKQSRPIPKINKVNNNNEYNLDVLQKVKSYDIVNSPKIYPKLSYIYNDTNPNNLNQNNNKTYINQHIEIITHKDPSAPILNQNYLNTIQNLNMNNNHNYQVDSLRSSSSSISRGSSVSSSNKKYDKFGNPIYPVSLNDPLKKNKNYQNKRILYENANLKKNSLRNNNMNYNYSPHYYQRSLSQDDFKSQNSRVNRFSDKNSICSSPHASPEKLQKSNDIINNNNYLENAVNIKIDEKYKNIINHYLNTDLTHFSTFSPDSYKYFYPNNEEYFKVPDNEIYIQKEVTQYYNNDPNQKITYTGSVNKLGNKHGFGRLITPSSKIIGTWRNGVFTGWGREIKNNGEIFEGVYNNGKLNGKGIYKYKDILYVGDFENNKKQGKGEKITKKYYYKGYFNNNKIDGYGTIQFINSEHGISEYIGFFKNNNIEGKGVMKWTNGNIYEGEMKDGKMNGYGRFIPKNGNPIEAYFKDGVKDNKKNNTIQSNV